MKFETGNSKVLLLGHRGVRPPRRNVFSGSSALPPENTIAAFQYALDHGCDGFEFDVRQTSDGRNVLCHDAKLAGREIAGSSLPELCDSCNTEVACLEEVLQRFGASAYLDIELKVQGGEESVIDALRQHRPQCFVISSFLPPVLLRLHELDDSLPLGFLCDREEQVAAWRGLPVQTVIPKHRLVSQRLVDHVHEGGLQLFAWTVNRKRDLLRLAAWGVDGLISDDPGLLRRTFPIL